MKNQKKYDLVVFIGRFQPLHEGHVAIMEEAYKYTDTLLVLVGSSFKARSPKNPLLFGERKDIITHELYDIIYGSNNKFFIEPLVDDLYDDNEWITQVQYQIDKHLSDPEYRGALIGYEKDLSSQYLKWFPNVDLIKVEEPTTHNNKILNATDIRNDLYYNNIMYSGLQQGDVLEDYLEPHLDSLSAWHAYNESYEDEWGKGPHLTGDAVVVQSGHILLIKRKNDPGKDLWALPGGFINPNERILDGVVRELREETCLKVPEKVLHGSIKDKFIADHPDRSERSRIISWVYFFQLDNTEKLPRVKGSDDAAEARWIPISVYKKHSFREQMFEDHADIIDQFI